MNREIAKSRAQSRDCHCVNGKDRDNNYDAVIDEVFDWHEKEVKNLTIPVVVLNVEVCGSCKIPLKKFNDGRSYCSECLTIYKSN